MPSCAPPFCNCKFPETPHEPLKLEMLQRVRCRCGESDDLHRLHWTWKPSPETDALVSEQDVIFHPTYSQGTCGVRGTQELSVGMVHYWEIRMISTLTGTDTMFGIGTEEVTFEPHKFAFVAALGIDSQSWGYSYHGYLQHMGKRRSYGRQFTQGCLLGILLDRTRGHLEYYLNRRPLGIAFNNIPMDPTVKLYPYICSTSAKSIVRLINAISEPACLQLHAYRALTQSPTLMQQLLEMPGLRSIIRKYWFFAPEIYADCGQKKELDLRDEALLSVKQRHRKHKYTLHFNEDTEEDIYANMHKIIDVASDSEDEHVPNELIMDEYFRFGLNH